MSAPAFSTYISELDQPQLPQLTDAVIFRAGLQEQLRQAHLLTPKHHLYLPHRPPPPPPPPPPADNLPVAY